SPTSGPPGTRIDVVATGFPPDATVEIGVGRPYSEYDVIATAETDAAGRAETQITMPAFVEPGDPYVIVVADEYRPVKAVSEAFDVTSGPTPTPSGEDGDGDGEENLFTRANIYLVAIGDEGESGEEIGCGDSLIPVEVEIEPTVAPMTAALEKLLAIDTREYGQSGLYNALYQSDLTVEGIDIEDREAIIELSGELVVGGVCDSPRVQAQLQQTALQYSTVDEVSIFINGEPLDEVLSQQG
ncbi:MAG: GerMN domain-containing protein, partial [Anaerolineales bacterium]